MLHVTRSGKTLKTEYVPVPFQRSQSYDPEEERVASEAHPLLNQCKYAELLELLKQKPHPNRLELLVKCLHYDGDHINRLQHGVSFVIALMDGGELSDAASLSGRQLADGLAAFSDKRENDWVGGFNGWGEPVLGLQAAPRLRTLDIR